MTWLAFAHRGVVSASPSAADMTSLARAAGSPPSAFWPAYRGHRRSYEIGEMTADDYWPAVASDAGFALDRSVARSLTRLDVASQLRPRLGVRDLVGTLSLSSRFRLALFANAGPEVARAVEAAPARSLFEYLIFSSDVRSVMPDRQYFRAAAATLRASASEIVFVDSHAENLAAAAAYGLHTVHLVSERQLRADLVAAITRRWESSPLAS